MELREFSIGSIYFEQDIDRYKLEEEDWIQLEKKTITACGKTKITTNKGKKKIVRLH